MKVILREDVQHLGDVGEIVNVKPGFARNYLIPQGLAVQADEKNVKKIEHERRLIRQQLAKLHGAASELSAKIEGLPITITRKVGEQDKLFGSVTARDINEALQAEGHSIQRRQIRLAEAIKDLGVYEVQVRLHPEVSPKIRVWVVAE
ncbi:MAG: 50S ribosomal protein L9 [Deltaproteobacteria bacterium]|nr:50S ribosomal protein L9 [Deltaproteobacteria bacterium]